MASSSSSSNKRKREKRKERKKRKKERREERRRRKAEKREAEAKRKAEEEVVDFSVTEAKESLGLGEVKDINEVDDAPSTEYMSFKKKYKKASKKLKKKLKPELTCSLCLDVLKQPVTASCGHSYCRICLCRALTKLTDEFNRFNCPQCRKQLCIKCLKRFAVNKSLSIVLETLFKECKPTEKENAIFQIELKKYRGIEANDAIYRPLIVRTEEFEVKKGVTCKRTVITDPADPVMRFALGLSHEFEKCFSTDSYSDFSVYFLQLEEDEDNRSRSRVQCGFPFLFLEPSSIYQKQDFDKDIKIKYTTEHDNTELSVEALNGCALFQDIFVHPQSVLATLSIHVPEYPQLQLELEFNLKEMDGFYRREVFSPINQNFVLENDDNSSSQDDDLSEASFETIDDGDVIGHGQSMDGFIVPDDDIDALNEVDSESEPETRPRRRRRLVRPNQRRA